MKTKKRGRPRFGVKKFFPKRVKNIPSSGTVSEMARGLNVSTGTVFYWVFDGLESVKKKRDRIIKKQDLIRYLRKSGRMIKKREY